MRCHQPWQNAPSSRSPLDSRVRLSSGATEPRPITAREREVWALLASGATRKAIARDLGISYYTVRNHLDRLREALACATNNELVALYYGATPYSRRCLDGGAQSA